MKSFIKYVILTTLIIFQFSEIIFAVDIVVNPGKFFNYYHLAYILTPENCELVVPTSERYPPYDPTNEFKFSSGGQFEVFVSKDQFKIPAPNTKSKYLILRMPYTSPDNPKAQEFIHEKRLLFDRIKKMKESGSGTVEVIVELSPEFTNILSKEPLELEIAGRNIFFRQAKDKYIDNTSTLNSKY